MPHDDAPQLKRVFDETLKKIGTWVVYTRSDHRFRCIDCYNLDTGDSRVDCERCFGTGYLTTLERWLVYPSTSLLRPSPTAVDLLKAGFTNLAGFFVYTRAEEVPVANDRFFVVEWTVPRDEIFKGFGQPFRIQEALRIDYPEPNLAGQVIFYTANCEQITETVKRLERVLLQAPIRVTRAF
jgi:hypothetical protein